MKEVSCGVVGGNLRIQLRRPVQRHDTLEAVNRFGSWDKADGPQPGEGQLQLLLALFGSPLLAECTRKLWFPHVSVDESGGGVPIRHPLHHLRHYLAPRVSGLLQLVQVAVRALKWVLAARVGRL